MNTVDVSVEEGLQADDQALTALALRLLEAAGLEEAELSVLITDDAQVQALNAEWRHKDEPTDVLSFPQQEGEITGGMLGDVVISLDTARVQAAALGHPVEEELTVLLVHGLCHLLGHDHLEPEEAAEMAALEARLLSSVGVPEGAARVGLVVRGGAAG